jgi:hypothetical protein
MVDDRGDQKHRRRERPVTSTQAVVHLRTETTSTSEQRRTARDEIIRASEREFVAAVDRALNGEETSTHRACAVQWGQILEGLRATRL